MNRNTSWTKALAGAVAIFAACLLMAAPAQAADGRSAGGSSQAVADDPLAAAVDEYIVTLRKAGARQPSAVAATARGLSTQFGGEVMRTYRHALDGFLIKLPAERAEALAKHPSVASVRPNRTGVFTACDPDPCPIQVAANSWGRDYIDGRTSTLDNLYHYDTRSNGFGVTAYVLDSGLGEQFAPNDFGGRASWGPNFRAQNGHEFSNWPHTDSRDDCGGHGTNVAGIIGSTTWGMARMVSIKALRIGTACTDNFGQFHVGDVIDAIDWVIDQQLNGSRSIINFSATVHGGDADLDTAFAAAMQAGIPVVAAAGNSNTNECATASPQRVPGVITVGAHTRNTGKASFSNYGPCVDLYAPGEQVTTTSKFNNQSSVVSGTSFAAPHVTGLAARFMQEWELFAPSPSTVESTLVHNTTTGSGTRNAHGSWFRQPAPTCDVSDLNDTDVAIPSTGSIDSPIAIAGCYDDDGFGQYYVGKVRVSYALQHPRPSDVKIDLVSPGSTPTTYSVRNAGQTGSTGIADLDVVNKPRLGTWKLRLTDTVSGQTGYLNRWFIGF